MRLGMYAIAFRRQSKIKRIAQPQDPSFFEDVDDSEYIFCFAGGGNAFDSDAALDSAIATIKDPSTQWLTYSELITSFRERTKL